MKLLEAILIDRIKRTASVESFRFTLAERIDFFPGQFLQAIFDKDNQTNKELNKYLSFSSSPMKDYIEVTKRLSNSKFSQRLSSLRIGDRILLKAPLGSCVFKDDYKKIGFLIGGIGITPAISIIEYIVDKKLDTDILLIYSNRTEEDIAFRKELDNWKSINNNLKVLYSITECEPKDKDCFFGRIDKDLFAERAMGSGERIFFIFGPPVMVEAMRNLCLEMNCDKQNIKSEIFVGY